jgi:hypothetical protein
MRVTVIGCDLNRSTQQSNLFVEKRNVADETETSDLLHKRAKDLDVGPLAKWRLYARHRQAIRSGPFLGTTDTH